jgi:cbb3-type cytochrome oxidase maturation protein
MLIIYVVLPVALILAGVALAAFIWAVRRGQFDDLDTPGVRVLFDDEPTTTDNSDPKNKDADE